jgi:ComF family protein
MSITKDTVLRCLAVLFPPVCLACSRVEGVRSLPLGLCSNCRSRLREVVPGGPGSEASGSYPELVDTICLWRYEPPFDRVIHGLKYGRLEYLGRDLADGLHHRMKEVEREVDLVVPIPLHWLRLFRRGYNQAEAIARPLAASLGHPLVAALRRRQWTGPQTRLSRRERASNLRSAFTVKRYHRRQIASRRVALVDDVITTGATIQAAATALREAGAGSILALAAARTPARERSCGIRNFDSKPSNSV